MKNCIKRITGLSVTKGSIMQTVEVEVTELDGSSEVERHQDYGFSGLPENGSNGLMISVGGHRFVVALDHPDKEPGGMVAGDVQVWHKSGDYMRLTGGAIEIKTPHLTVNAADTTFKGSVQVDQDINVTGQGVISGIDIDDHTHPGDSGGTTGAPN